MPDIQQQRASALNGYLNQIQSSSGKESSKRLWSILLFGSFLFIKQERHCSLLRYCINLTPKSKTCARGFYIILKTDCNSREPG